MAAHLDVEAVVGIVHGPRLRAWEVTHGDVVAAQLRTPPTAWAEDLTAFVHLICGDELVAQADGAPLHGAFPFPVWRVGDTWRETRVLPSTNVTNCELQLGLYVLSSVERVPVTGGGDAVTVPLP